MKIVRSMVGVSVLLLITSCGVSQAEFEKLKAENAALKIELDELRNGEGRLAAVIDKAYSEKNYEVAKKNIDLLIAKHPESTKIAEYKPILEEISRIEATENEKKATDEKARIRLANLDNTGIWSVNFYVDNFGEKTKSKYIANSEHIHGEFSNTATQDSKLNVDLLIDGPKRISIKLYEYAGRNPVKATSSTRYAVRLKDKDGQKYEIYATNSSERLTLEERDAQSFHNALMKGGRVQVWIEEVERPTNQYQFTIDSADWYDNAYQKLTAD